MKVSDWISVKDRLPKTGERVLVLRKVGDEVFPDIAAYTRRADCVSGYAPIFYLDDGFDTESVTHWQKIVLPKRE